MKNKPKANLYMLIKIEIDKDIKDTTEFKKGNSFWFTWVTKT